MHGSADAILLRIHHGDRTKDMRIDARRGQQQNQKRMPELQHWTMDVLETLSDDDLYTLMIRLEDERNKMFRNGYQEATIRAWETELAYILREIDVRQTRKRAHARWLADMGAMNADRPAN